MDEIQILKNRIEELESFVKKLRASTTIPYDVDQAFRVRLASTLDLPNGFDSAPLDPVDSPTGGATVDSEARTAIDALITRLEDLGLIKPN